MPTFDGDERFWRDYARLTPARQREFRRAVQLFIEGLRTRQFHPSLRVKRFESSTGDEWEMSWARDGRALFRYGSELRPGHQHVTWLRVGSHDIFRNR